MKRYQRDYNAEMSYPGSNIDRIWKEIQDEERRKKSTLRAKFKKKIGFGFAGRTEKRFMV